MTSAPLTRDNLKIDTASGVAVITLDGTELAPFRRSQRTYTPLVCDLADQPVAAAAHAASDLVRKLPLYPGDVPHLLDTFTQITQWAQHQQRDRLVDLTGASATALILDLADVPDLRFNPAIKAQRGRVNEEHQRAKALRRVAEDRRRAHYVRNALLALRAAGVMRSRRSHRQRHQQDSLAFGLPSLPPLTDRKGRPLTDEELLLARMMAEIDIREGHPPRPILAMMIAENGVPGIPSTTLTKKNLDDPHTPRRLINVPGVWKFDARDLDLTPYTAKAMPRVLLKLRHDFDQLTYDGNVPGTEAADATLSGVIGRRLRRAGITDPCVTARSVSTWRSMHALLEGKNFSLVRHFLGGRTINVLRQLHIDQITNTTTGLVTVRERSDASNSMRLTIKEFHDKSITMKGNPTKKSPSNKK